MVNVVFAAYFSIRYFFIVNKLFSFLLLGTALSSSSVIAADSYLEAGYQKQSFEYSYDDYYDDGDSEDDEPKFSGINLSGRLGFENNWFVGFDYYENKDKNKYNETHYNYFSFYNFNYEVEMTISQYSAYTGYQFDVSQDASLSLLLKFGHIKTEAEYNGTFSGTYYDYYGESTFTDTISFSDSESDNYFELNAIYNQSVTDALSFEVGAALRKQDDMNDKTNQDVALMAALEYEFVENLSARLSYKKFNNFAGAQKMDITSLSLRYTF